MDLCKKIIIKMFVNVSIKPLEETTRNWHLSEINRQFVHTIDCSR